MWASKRSQFGGDNEENALNVLKKCGSRMSAKDL